MNKKVKNKTNKVIIMIIIIMLFNFVMPNYSRAGIITDWVTHKILDAFAELLLVVPDALFSALQGVFVGDASIYEDDKYSIKFSPGTIFAGKIPAFDIDFISDKGNDASNDNTGNNDENNNNDTSNNNVNLEGQNKTPQEFFDDCFAEMTAGNLLSEYGNTLSETDFLAKKTAWENGENGTFTKIEKTEEKSGGMNDAGYRTESKYQVTAYCTNNNNQLILNYYCKLEYTRYKTDVRFPGLETVDSSGINYYNAKIEQNTFYNKDNNNNDSNDTTEKEEPSASVAEMLRHEISTWYNALKNVALVALLSILVYIAIRIIMSSAAKDKAKYKKMLGNWLTAICLLFILHFIVSLMFTATRSYNRYTWKICCWS